MCIKILNIKKNFYDIFVILFIHSSGVSKMVNNSPRTMTSHRPLYKCEKGNIGKKKLSANNILNTKLRSCCYAKLETNISENLFKC